MPRNSDSEVLSHWHTLFEDFSTSTQDFYAAVEQAVGRRNLPGISVSRVRFKEGGVGTPDREYLRIKRNRIAFDICSAPYGNGHFFSWWLARVSPRYGLFIVAAFVIMCLPLWAIFQSILSKILGDSRLGLILMPLSVIFAIPVIFLLLGFAVERGSLGDEEWVLSVPWIGYLYAVVFNPATYYRLDTAMMFRDSVRSAVNEVINGLREEKGLRLLGEDDFLPDREEEAS